MKRLLDVFGVMAVVAMLAGATEACTAESTVDRAKSARNTDAYKAARDVSEEFVDEEGFVKDESTYEAGAGTLLTEMDTGLTVSNDGKDASDWKAVLDTSSFCYHGVSKNEDVVHSKCTVREHMRLHVREWENALKGNELTAMETWGGVAPQAPAGGTADPAPSLESPAPAGDFLAPMGSDIGPANPSIDHAG